MNGEWNLTQSLALIAHNSICLDLPEFNLPVWPLLISDHLKQQMFFPKIELNLPCQE